MRRDHWRPDLFTSVNSFHLTRLMRLWYTKMTYSWAIISLVMDNFQRFLSCNAKKSKHMSQLNANQFWHGLGQKFGYQSIDDWLNRFLRYCHFKSVSDGHSAPNDKRGRDMLIIRELTTRARLNLKKLHKQAIKMCAISGSSDDTASVKQYVAFHQKCQKIDH